MKDKQIVKIYEKGIGYQFISNTCFAFFSVGLYILLRINGREDTDQLLLVALIGLVIGLVLVMIITPIKWKILEKKYEKIKTKKYLKIIIIFLISYINVII